MKRRQFLVGSAAGLGVTAGVAGCLGLGSATPPPRESEVFDLITWTNGALKVVLMQQPIITSRADFDVDRKKSKGKKAVRGPDSGLFESLNPIGIASAAKGGRGRGATGRGMRGRGGGSKGSIPKGRNGRYKWHGGTYAGWYDDHEDEVEEYRCTISECAIASLGPLSMTEEDLPGAGPVDWDKQWSSPSRTMRYGPDNGGWYRIGAHLNAARASYDFGWEAVDFQLKPTGTGNYVVRNQWKISPRL